MTEHKPYTAAELAEIERLVQVAEGNAPRQFWNGDDNTPLNYHEKVTGADGAEADRLAKLMRELK